LPIQGGRVRVELDLGNNDALENTTVNVDVARCPGILDKETLLLQNLVSTDGENILGVRDGDRILELRARDTGPARSLDRDRRGVSDIRTLTLRPS
jgi:hypothetical protein